MCMGRDPSRALPSPCASAAAGGGARSAPAVQRSANRRPPGASHSGRSRCLSGASAAARRPRRARGAGELPPRARGCEESPPPCRRARGPVAGRSCGAGCAGGGAPSGRSTLSREPAIGQTTHLTVRGDRRVALDRATRDVLKFAVAREGAHSPPRSSPAQARHSGRQGIIQMNEARLAAVKDGRRILEGRWHCCGWRCCGLRPRPPHSLHPACRQYDECYERASAYASRTAARVFCPDRG